MMEHPVCFVCKKPDPDYYTDGTGGRLWIHERCCLTQEQAEALMQLMFRFKDKPPEEH